jgi:hypothetical protein
VALRFGGIWKAGSTAPQADRAALDRIKAWAKAALGLDDAATVSCNEIVCADPACPGTETIILVMIPGQRTKAYKVQAAAADVTEEAVTLALRG